MNARLGNEVQKLLIAEACFQHCFEDARSLAEKQGITWRDLAFVFPHREAFDRRQETYQKEPPQKVNFKSVAEPIILSRLNGFKPIKEIAEGLSFTRALSTEVLLLVRFDKLHGWGVGKMFELHIGICIGKPDQAKRSTHKFTDNAFRIFRDHFRRPTWAYHTRQELEYCCMESTQLLARVLPLFESCCMRYFKTIPERLPNDLGGERRASARQAWATAVTAAETGEVKVLLEYAACFPRILAGLPPGAEVPTLFEGRLAQRGMWRFIAQDSNEAGKQLIVDVPFHGPVRFGWSESAGVREPLGEWMDSTEAIQRMRIALKDPKFNPSQLQLQGSRPSYWLASSGPKVIRVDATSGEPLPQPM